MPLFCTPTAQRLAAASSYLQMAKNSPGPGLIKPFKDDDDCLDFSDPTRAIFRMENASCEVFQFTREDPINGFPNPQTMTNFVEWMSYYICISDGLIWSGDRDTEAWSVVALQNTEENMRARNSRHDFLCLEDETMTLVKFLDDNNEQVYLRQFVLHLLPHRPIHTSVDTESVRSISSQSSTSEGENAKSDDYLQSVIVENE